MYEIIVYKMYTICIQLVVSYSLKYLGYYQDNGNGAVIVQVILLSLFKEWGNSGIFPVVWKYSKS